jgi:TRAP-type C4-dicarboxylate transport system substrate-binding protein
MLLRKLVPFALALAPLVALPSVSQADPLKFGTEAPPESPWGKVFKVWARAINDRTNGSVQIQFFWNGQQGDEAGMVGKIRTGQLDGAAITATGLSAIYKQTLVFQLPGLFSSWAKLDAARVAMRPAMDAEFEKQGFKILGWGDIGISRFMSSGFDVKTPADLKHKNVFYTTGDPIAPVLFSVLGDVTPKSMSDTEVLTQLTANAVNVVDAPPLAAEQLQWASRLDHINTLPTHYEIGALVMSSPRIKSLPADAQAVILETGKVAGDALTASIRALDDAALGRRKQRMVAYDPTAAEVAQWTQLFADTRTRLRGSVFNAAVFDDAVRYAN